MNLTTLMRLKIFSSLLFALQQFRQDEAHHEDGRRTEYNRQVGMELRAEFVEGLSLVNKGREAHPGDDHQTDHHAQNRTGTIGFLAGQSQQEGMNVPTGMFSMGRVLPGLISASAPV